jgi:hypothetical protein
MSVSSLCIDNLFRTDEFHASLNMEGYVPVLPSQELPDNENGILGLSQITESGWNPGAEESRSSQFELGRERFEAARLRTSRYENEALKKIINRSGLSFSFYNYEGLLENGDNFKARLACLEFHAVASLRRRDFIRDLGKKVAKAHESTHGGFGFAVRFVTHFQHEERFWVAFVSLHPMLFKKWGMVFKGLEALDIRVYHVVRTVSGSTRPSLHGVMDMFKDVTLAELTSNLIDFSPKNGRMRGRKQHACPATPECPSSAEKENRSSGRKRRPTPDVRAIETPEAAEPSSSPSAKATRRQQRKRPIESPQVSPVQAKKAKAVRSISYDPRPKVQPIRATVFTGPVEDLVEKCVAYLKADSLAGADVLWKAFSQYLDGEKSRGQIGMFLLRIRVGAMFAQVGLPPRSV